MTNYASLQETHDQEEAGIMYHKPEPTRSKWNHITDLDSFFTRVYNYHQNHGFLCMLLKETFNLNQFVFVVSLSIYLIHGINYDTLFNYRKYPSKPKPTLKDIILPVGQCVSNFTGITWFFVTLAIVYLVLKTFVKFYQMICFWDIKQFYNTALGIQDKDLDNMTWHDVQTLLKEAQFEHQMCIHKMELTELDIYHRILRHQNYLVALVNKRLLPPRIYVPFIGELAYWTSDLRYNILGLLFWTPLSLFGSPHEQHPEFKKHERRHFLAQQLSKQIMWLAIINLALAPLTMMWQLVYSFFHYAELIKREPGKIGIRSWSLYGRLYVRHFNELDHELNARLGRAYRPITQYMASFTSPVATVIAQHVQFICGAIFAVIVGLTIYDEDVLAVENVLTIMTGLGAVIAICRGLIPDESVVWCPQVLLENVVMHTHYLPAKWRENAHSSETRSEVQQIFQYRFVTLTLDIFSAFLTPYVLLRWVYPRSLDIVDFFRCFTVYVEGVGNVCSFAEMDVTKHGDPDWQIQTSQTSLLPAPSQSAQAENGKVELSLVHFANINPSWVPKTEGAQQFVSLVQDEVSPIYLESDPHVIKSMYNFPTGSIANLHNMQSMFNIGKARDARSSLGVNAQAQLARKSVYLSEGPDISTQFSMTNNMLVLHNINSMKQEEKQERHVSLPAAPEEESTPLLSKDQKIQQRTEKMKELQERKKQLLSKKESISQLSAKDDEQVGYLGNERLNHFLQPEQHMTQQGGGASGMDPVSMTASMMVMDTVNFFVEELKKWPSE